MIRRGYLLGKRQGQGICNLCRLVCDRERKIDIGEGWRVCDLRTAVGKVMRRVALLPSAASDVVVS